MREQSYAKLSQRINRLRWQVPALAFLSVLADQLLEHIWLSFLPDWGHFVSQVFFYGVIGSALAWWALTSLRRRVDETETAQRALEQAHTALSEANQRLEFLVQVNRRLAEAEDEEALIEVILELPLEVVPALGCSLIRLDERGRPSSAVHRGSLDPAVFEAWTSHLSATERGHPCESCSAPRAVDPTPCPRLTSPLAATVVSKVQCLGLARGHRTYGLLNIYLQNAEHPTTREQALLATMANEMALALESHHLRLRELTTLYRLQQAHQLNNLHSGLAEDHSYLLLGDEEDELFGLSDPQNPDLPDTARTYIFDVRDLDHPQLIGTFDSPAASIDHNLFIKEDRVYQAHYTAGVRVLDSSDVANGNLSEVGHIDTEPCLPNNHMNHNINIFVGPWGVYPFFDSGSIIASDGLNELIISRLSE